MVYDLVATEDALSKWRSYDYFFPGAIMWIGILVTIINLIGNNRKKKQKEKRKVQRRWRKRIKSNRTGARFHAWAPHP